MTHVAIAGAGLGGLAAALFLARRGHQVSLVEKDASGPPAKAETAFEDWRRFGVGQARQSHAFLAPSVDVLRAEAPDVLQAIVDAGALLKTYVLPGEPDGSQPLQGVCARRLPYEASVRTAVEREANVTLITGAEAVGLIARPSGSVPHVVGLKLDDGQEIAADFVVDAMGRWSKAPEWLSAIGAEPPAAERQDCEFFYLTRYYRLREGVEYPEFRGPTMSVAPYGSFIAFAGDNRTFSLTIILSMRDPLRARPRDPEVYDRLFAHSPKHAPWLERGVAITEPQVLARIENRAHYLVVGGKPVVTGLALVGDSALHTNPTYGRGVSLAYAQAQHFARTVDEAEKDPAGFIMRFEGWTHRHLDIWFQAQVGMDSHRLKVIAAALEGRVAPPAEGPVLYQGAVHSLADSDPVVGRALMRWAHLLITPSELMADQAVASRVATYLDAKGPTLPMTGLPRAEFEGLVGA